MNEMYSDTHSCTVSFASLLTLAEVGSEFFMIRATFAICDYQFMIMKNLRPESIRPDPP